MLSDQPQFSESHLSQRDLKSLLTYSPETGVWVWRRREGNTRAVNSFNTRYAGTQAGALLLDGYIGIRVLNRLCRAHRLAFLYVAGEVPAEVDHRNGDRTDNRWANLRSASRAENNQNRARQSNNTSGYAGVFLDKRCGKWRAKITVNRIDYDLGAFDDREAAAAAYARGKQKYHPFSPIIRP